MATPTAMEDMDRYSRQERFAGIGKQGQERLARSKLLIVGAGALGSACAETLVRAGTGQVTLVDRDYVEWSNLQRQQLYTEQDARERLPKAIAAANRLRRINSAVQVRGIVADVTVQEIRDLAEGMDLIIDATDNFEVRMLINDLSQQAGIPWIYGACTGSYGLSLVVLPGVTPCLHCLLEQLPAGGDTCDTAGIIAPAVQLVAAYQTAEALKLLTGNREALRGTLLSCDLWTGHHAEVNVSRLKRRDCPSCGQERTYPYLSAASHSRSAVLCGRDTVQIRPARPMTLNLAEWAERLSSLGQVEHNPYMLSFTYQAWRLAIFPDGRVLVHGTSDLVRARTLYHRFFG